MHTCRSAAQRYIHDLNYRAALILCIFLFWLSPPAAAQENPIVAPLDNWHAWGAGETAAAERHHHGQAIIPSTAGDVVDISAGGFHNAALRTDGTVMCWGRNEEGQCNVPGGLNNVRQVEAGFL